MADSTRSGKVAHLRLPEDLHAALAAFASRTHRSMNGAAIYLLEDALARQDQPSATTATENDVHLR